MILSYLNHHLFIVLLSVVILTLQLSGCSGKTVSLAESQTTISLIEKGDKLFKKGDYQLAQRLFQKALERAQDINDLSNESLALKHLSVVYLSLEDYAKSIQKAKKSLAIAQEVDNPTLTRNVLNTLGLAYYWQEEYTKAINIYKQAIVIPAESAAGNWKILDNLGLAYYWQTDYQNAIDSYENALTYAEQDGSHTLISGTLKNLGDTFFWKGDYDQSIAYFLRALPFTNNEEQKGNLYIALGNSYSKKDQYENAIKQFETALEILNKSENTYIKTNTLISMALAYVATGNPMEGIVSAKKAINLAAINNHPALESNAWNIMAGALQTLNRIEAAIKAFEKGLDLASHINNAKQEKIAAAMGLSTAHQTLGNYIAAPNALEIVLAIEDLDPSIEQLIILNLGQLYINMGGYHLAIKYFKKNIELAEAGTDLKFKIDAYEKLGNTYFTGGFYNKANAQYLISLDQAKKHKYPAQQVTALANLAWSHSKGNLETAKDYAEQSVDLSKHINDPWRKAESLHALATLQKFTQDPNLIKTANELLILSKKTKGFPVSLAMEIVGAAHEQVGDFAKAIHFYHQSLSLNRQAKDRLGEGLTLASLGAVYQKAGSLEAAESAFRQTIEIWESLRTRLGNHDKLKVSLLDKQRETYQKLQSVLVAQGKTSQALEVSEKGRARALVELIRRRHIPEENNTEGLASPRSAEMVKVAKDQNITIVEFAVTIESIFIWVIKPNGQVVFEKVDVFMPSAVLTPAAMANRSNTKLINISKVISDTRDAFTIDNSTDTKTKNSKDFDKDLETLYSLLIEPISSYLPKQPEERVIFIPQGDLFQVPFPALKDRDGHYLIEKHTIQTATSIKLLNLAHNLRGAQQTSAKHQASLKPLVVGNPTMPVLSTSSRVSNTPLANLPGAEKEALAIAKLFNVSALIGEAATEKTVKDRLKTASLVHFATHGLLDYGDPQESGVRDMPGAIALAPDTMIGTSDGDGLLTSSEIMELSLSAEMVVLSACNTGKGNITADGVIGLSRALIAAGIPSIIVSLWAVPDSPTSDLMTTFYSNLMKTRNKAQALRQAMLTTMVIHQNPMDWAAFTLIGEAL